MTTLREAAQMALEALENLNNSIVLSNGEEDVIKALRQALASEQAMDVLIFSSQEMGAYDNLVQEIKLYDDGIKPKEK